MDLIEITRTEPTPAEIRAENLLLSVNAELASRVEAHKRAFSDFWDAEDTTPDEILAAMGPHAQLWLAAATESASHIARLAAIVGKTLDDFLLAEFYAPRRVFVMGSNGTISLEP